MQDMINEADAPEWASRLLKIREWANIVRENPSTVYRKIDAGLYPPIIHIGNSSRLAGWECWRGLKERMAERDGEAA